MRPWIKSGPILSLTWWQNIPRPSQGLFIMWSRLPLCYLKIHSSLKLVWSTFVNQYAICTIDLFIIQCAGYEPANESCVRVCTQVWSLVCSVGPKRHCRGNPWLFHLLSRTNIDSFGTPKHFQKWMIARKKYWAMCLNDLWMCRSEWISGWNIGWYDWNSLGSAKSILAKQMGWYGLTESSIRNIEWIFWRFILTKYCKICGDCWVMGEEGLMGRISQLVRVS